jgi:hypothetical protein
MNVSVIALVAIVNVTVLVAIIAVNKSITTFSTQFLIFDMP